MTSTNFISVLKVCILTLVIVSCKISPTITFKVTQLNTTIKPKRISISELAENYKNYQGQYIETTGKFFQAFEQFSISTDKDLPVGEAKAFWLGTDKDLNIDEASFNKMNGKRITIKGLIDTTRKGHLSSYLATIDEIYFWEQQ